MASTGTETAPPPPPLPSPVTTIPLSKTNEIDKKIRERMQMNEATRKQLEKQRAILSELIFPPHIPHKCHGKVEGIVNLLRDLSAPPKGFPVEIEQSSPNENNNNNSKDTHQEGSWPKVSDSHPFTFEEWHKIRFPPTQPAALPNQNNFNSYDKSSKNNKKSALMILNDVDDKCGVYRRRAQEFRRQIETKRSKALSLNQPFSEKENAHEEAAKATIHELNYRFCIAKESCPNRMRVLQQCWQGIGPEGIKKLAELGPMGQDMICKDQRRSLERCCGKLLQKLINDAI